MCLVMCSFVGTSLSAISEKMRVESGAPPTAPSVVIFAYTLGDVVYTYFDWSEEMTKCLLARGDEGMT